MRIVEELKRIEWEHLEEGCKNLSTLYSLKEWTVDEKKHICKLIESNNVDELTEYLDGVQYEDDYDPTPEFDLEVLEKVWDIANRYATSHPVSGDWDTETIHEMRTLRDELGLNPEEVIQIMVNYLGFSPMDLPTEEFLTEGCPSCGLEECDKVLNPEVPNTLTEEDLRKAAKEFKSDNPDIDLEEGMRLDDGNSIQECDNQKKVEEEFHEECEAQRKMEENKELKEFDPVFEDAQRDEIRAQAKNKVEQKFENEEEKFERIKDHLGESFDFYEEYGEEADNVYNLLEEIDSFVKDYDDNYADEVGDDDGIEYAYINLKHKGPAGMMADLDELTQDARFSDDEEDLEYWDRHYGARYDNIIEALKTFYDDPHTPIGEFLDEDIEERIADYRKYAGLKEGVEITEENIDDRALSKVACLNYRSKDDVKAELLGKR